MRKHKQYFFDVRKAKKNYHCMTALDYTGLLLDFKKEHKLTVKQLAKLLKIPVPTVQGWLVFYTLPNEKAQKAIGELVNG